jgi:hypothetical protein
MPTAPTQDPEVLEREIAPTLPEKAGATIDVQVATARRYPRSITTFIRRATEMATLTPEIAASCVYALPRGGKTIEGPSARLAEIVASAWGNLRVQAGATDNDDRYITARGEAFDVETNTAIGFEVRRRITNRNGQTYDDDMITVTGNAAASIALRNAVFKVVPSPFWRPIYLKCRQVIAGDAKTFAARRDDMLKAFMVAGVTNETLCAGIGLKGVADITLDHMATLVAILNAIKEGETTVEDAFADVQPNGGTGTPAPQPTPRRSKQAAKDIAHGFASPTPAPEPTPAPAPTPAPEPEVSTPEVGAVATVSVLPNGAALITLSTGFKAATTSKELIAGAQMAQKQGVIIELVTHASSKGPGFARILDEIVPVEG